ncbi:hypothetical protein [Methylobacterium tarhaniae]
MTWTHDQLGRMTRPHRSACITCPDGVERHPRSPYMVGMADNTSTPYTIEISPITKPAGQFQWAIRRNGKLIERSDRPHPTEAKAEASALAAVERSMHSAGSGRW